MNSLDSVLDSVKDLSFVEQRKVVFTFCQEISYGDIGSRNPLDVLEKGKGTCSGKNDLLKLFLEALGYEVKTFFQQHDYAKFPFHPFPKGLEKYQEQPIQDFTNFLKVRFGENWVDVSCTFERELGRFGFPSAAWDGETSMKLPFYCIGEPIPAKEDMPAHKKELLESSFSVEELTHRKNFLKDLTMWLDAARG